MTLREKIIAYTQTQPAIRRPTWWIQHHIDGFDTKVIRRELERMEREGLVIADRSQSNNTKWTLVASRATGVNA